jgi:hypothetical protein
VGSDGIVVLPPPFDHHLGLSEGVEYLAVEQFISQFSVEAFVVAVLPGATGIDEQNLESDPSEPALELRSLLSILSFHCPEFLKIFLSDLHFAGHPPTDTR